jgi:DNA-binding MarR family transcriptional regulator
MENLKCDFERYLNEALDITIKTQPWEGEVGLPFFLRNMYGFFQVSLLDTRCLVMVPRKEAEQTPATIRKHMLQVQKKWGHAVLYASRKISSFNRKRLIEHKVPFVVPGNQMYLPPLGIDLREHFSPPRNTRPKWRPSTQAAFLFAFTHAPKKGLTPKEMADRLGYAPMSMTRAFDDLEAAEVGQVVMEGRQRVLRLDPDRRALWEKVLGFLQSPVKKSVWVKLAADQRPGVEAGLTALARYTSLAGPPNPVFAMEGKEWQGLQSLHDVMELPVAEPDACQLEIWNYAPGLFAENGVADRFSLYLSLQDTEDERVESALEEMMEQIQW